MRTLRLTCTSLLLLALTASGITAQEGEKKTEATDQAYDLSVHHVEGLKSQYRQSQTTSMNMEIMGQKTESESLTQYEFEQECTEIDDDGNASLKAKYTRVVLHEEEDGVVTIDYDSDEDEVSSLEEGERLKALLKGLEMTFKVSPEGEISDLTGFEDYRERVKKEVSEMHAAMLESIAGDATMRDSMETSYRALPKDKVKIGDSWENKWTMPVPSMGEMTYNATYTLKAIEEKNGRKCAKVALTGDIDWAAEEDAAISMEYENTEWEGTLWIDLETRETVLSESTLSYDLKMDMGIQVTAPSEITLKFELIEEEKEGAEDTPGKD